MHSSSFARQLPRLHSVTLAGNRSTGSMTDAGPAATCRSSKKKMMSPCRANHGLRYGVAETRKAKPCMYKLRVVFPRESIKALKRLEYFYTVFVALFDNNTQFKHARKAITMEGQEGIRVRSPARLSPKEKPFVADRAPLAGSRCGDD